MSATTEMADLIERARREGLWLFTHYQSLWFAPDELERNQKAGRFQWGPENWMLRDPRERLAELEAAALRANSALESFRLRLR